MLYDLVLRIIRSKEEGCSAVFNHAQTLFTVIFFLFMVAKLLAPIWVMLFVFQPTPQPVVENDDIQPALTEDGTSAFAATPDEHYRQLYHPSDGYRSLSYDTPTSRSPVTSYSPATLYAPINNPVGSINSIPNGIPSKTVRPGGPNLGIIREENQSATSSHSRSANKHTDSKSRRNEQHIDRHAFDNKGVETDIIAPKLPPPPRVVRSSSGACAGTQSHKSTGSQSTGAGTQSKNNGASTQSHVSIESQSTGAGNHSRNTGAGNQSYLSTGSQSSGTDTQSRNTRNGTQPLAPEQQPISDRRLAVSANGNHHIEDKEEGPKFVISSDDSDSSP
ncbi:hypothetical protein DPMN_053979 [Dreissena polymorpha]|uniref:Uncharacterized protein n=1 Tax=Dreissena polymorpha TaxID=45954 RepID=A0A9D4CPG4_DREPO|nr:hypothetical protein DPMN_053979 [Dreissena polymorpha]